MNVNTTQKEYTYIHCNALRNSHFWYYNILFGQFKTFQSLCHSITATAKSNDIQVQKQSCATDTTSQQFYAYTLNPVEGIIEKSE